MIVRSDGVPTYNLVNPLDDAAMGITHVIRGDDLLPSTPRQVHVYRAIGAEIPRFAHLSMILGPNRQRLSKRDGAASVEQLRDAGYLPEAVVNYLALLGWSLDGERELFTLDELAGLFSLERVNAAPAVFDHQKLLWMNGVHMRALSQEALTERLVTFLRGDRLAARRAARAGRRGHAARAREDRDARRVRAATAGFLFGPVEIEPERARAHARERRAPTRCSTQAARAARRARAVRRGLDRAGAARARRGARAEAEGGLRADPDRAHADARSRPACSRARRCSGATRSLDRLSRRPRAARLTQRGDGPARAWVATARARSDGCSTVAAATAPAARPPASPSPGLAAHAAGRHAPLPEGDLPRADRAPVDPGRAALRDRRA